MEPFEVKIGEKVVYGGMTYIAIKFQPDGRVTIRQARRNYYGAYWATVTPDHLAPYEPKPKVSEHAKTCQICERAIFAATGVIAHHGYERPSHIPGYQTASCLGARELPFEKSRDVLGVYLVQYLQGWLLSNRQQLTICRSGKAIMHKKQRKMENGRPIWNERRNDYVYEEIEVRPGEDDYERLLAIKIAELESHHANMRRDYHRQHQRYRTWKPTE